jgi:hypothetical protein
MKLVPNNFRMGIPKTQTYKKKPKPDNRGGNLLLITVLDH